MLRPLRFPRPQVLPNQGGGSVAKANSGHEGHGHGLHDNLVGGDGNGAQPRHQHGKDNRTAAAHQLFPRRRQADAHDFLNPGPLGPEILAQAEAQGTVPAEQVQKPQDGRHILGTGGGQGSAGHAPLGEKADAEYQEVVKHHVEQVGKAHDIQRRLHIARPLENGKAVDHGKGERFCRRHYAQVGRAQADNLGIRVFRGHQQKAHYRFGAQKHRDSDDNPQGKGNHQGLPGIDPGLFALARPHHSGHKRRSADGKGV